MIPAGGTGLTPPVGGAGPRGSGGNASPGGGSSGGPSQSAGGSGNVGSGGGGNASASGGAGNASTAFKTDAGGYVTTGTWHGYAWTTTAGTTTTIIPSDFSTLAAGDPLCASGTVGAQADFGGVGVLGVNLNQAAEASSPTLAVTPTMAGITVQIDNRGGSPLRVQLQGPDGATSATDRWCAPIMAPGGFIPWSSFNTKCWDGTGTAYSRQPLVSASVIVPGTATTAVPFNYCLNGLAESNAPGASGTGGATGNGGATGAGGAGTGAGGTNTGAGGGPAMSGVGTLTQTFDSQPVSYNGTSFQITAQTGSNSTSGGPVSYPSVFIGSNYNRSTEGSNLPKLVSTIASVQTMWSNNAGSIGGSYNAAYDVWFSTSAAGDASAPSGGYLMVWFYDPPDAQPIGGVVSSGVTIPGASGSWDVWLGTNNGKPCISYVRTQPTGSLTFDLNNFIKDATAKYGQPIKSTWYLTNVFAGFEIWSGGVGLKTLDFTAIVN
jgi:hypothetical protein